MPSALARILIDCLARAALVSLITLPPSRALTTRHRARIVSSRLGVVVVVGGRVLLEGLIENKPISLSWRALWLRRDTLKDTLETEKTHPPSSVPPLFHTPSIYAYAGGNLIEYINVIFICCLKHQHQKTFTTSKCDLNEEISSYSYS